MKIRNCFLCALILLLQGTVFATLIQWKTEDGGNGHWYGYTIEGTWPEAENYAISQGGHLTAINSAEENDWIYQNFFLKTEAETVTPYWGWIGLYQLPGSPEPAGGWVWSNGDPVTFTNWRPGSEPNNQSNREHWAHIYPEWTNLGEYWNDWRIEDIVPVPGVMEVVPEPATLLLFGFGAVMLRRKKTKHKQYMIQDYKGL